MGTETDQRAKPPPAQAAGFRPSGSPGLGRGIPASSCGTYVTSKFDRKGGRKPARPEAGLAEPRGGVCAPGLEWPPCPGVRNFISFFFRHSPGKRRGKMAPAAAASGDRGLKSLVWQSECRSPLFLTSLPQQQSESPS